MLLDTWTPGSSSGLFVYRRLDGTDDRTVVCLLASFGAYEAEFPRLFPGVRVDRFLRTPVSAGELASEIRRLVTHRAGPVAPQSA